MEIKKGQRYKGPLNGRVYTITSITEDTISLTCEDNGSIWSGSLEYINNVFCNFTITPEAPK